MSIQNAYIFFWDIMYINDSSIVLGEERKLYKVLVGKPKGKRPHGRRKRRWEGGIRMDIREIGFSGSG
jgi:hypothetical protein